MITKNVQATSYQPLVAAYSFGDVDQNGRTTITALRLLGFQ